MTTVRKYQVTLTYKRSLSIEGSSDRKIHVGTKSQFQQICSGSSTEEVLYTIREYNWIECPCPTRVELDAWSYPHGFWILYQIWAS